jgi:hypothetical protein
MKQTIFSESDSDVSVSNSDVEDGETDDDDESGELERNPLFMHLYSSEDDDE